MQKYNVLKMMIHCIYVNLKGSLTTATQCTLNVFGMIIHTLLPAMVSMQCAYDMVEDYRLIAISCMAGLYHGQGAI